MFPTERDAFSVITDDYRLSGVLLRHFKDVLGPDEFVRIAEPCVVSSLHISEIDVRKRALRILCCEDVDFLAWVDVDSEEDVFDVFEKDPVTFTVNLVAEEFETDLCILEAVRRTDLIKDIVLAIASVLRKEDTLARRISSEASDYYADWLECRAGDGTVDEIIWGILEDEEED
ncbi:MAG: hypothetical protein Q4Q58_03465 [Thermoplasmata archaeon]|nr:hypothetical protein [Thermoplasmata archaeon]